MMTEPRTLNISLHDEKIGTLTLLPNEQTIFTFEDSYVNNPKRSTLSLSFENKQGDFEPAVKPSRIQVPPFFSNLLPEGPLRDYLADRAGVNAKREFFLLWALGEDLPGAVTASADSDWLPTANNEEKPSFTPDFMRFSLAGVQLKFSGVMQPKGGLTIPARGIGGSWIIKLPSPQYDAVPENEFSMMTLAHKMGMDVPEVQLVPLDKISGLPDSLGALKGREALAVKRFDRTDDGGKVHMEDFAQIFSIYPDHKYEKANYKNIAEVIAARVGTKGIAEYIRRLVFCTLIGNADMHLKNWSVIYPDKREPALAPAYDLLSTIPYIADKTMALRYVKTKNMADLSLELLTYMSNKAMLPEHLVLKTAKETVTQFRDAWQSEIKHLPISQTTADTILKNAERIRLWKEVG
jgi:serine/threonine-protein kinase HipA